MTDSNSAPTHQDADTLRRRAFDQLAGVMLDSGDANGHWTNGFDPDVSEMLANNIGGFYDAQYSVT
jgi:hypothetical protein